MDRKQLALLHKQQRLADQLRQSEGWKWHVANIELELANRCENLAADTNGSVDDMRVSQGFVAGLRWALADPERRGADASLEIDDDEQEDENDE